MLKYITFPFMTSTDNPQKFLIFKAFHSNKLKSNVDPKLVLSKHDTLDSILNEN